VDRKQIEDYIDQGLEIELLDKLRSFAVSELDDRAEGLIEFLIILQERSRIDWMQANQALLKLIVKLLPSILQDEDALKKFATLIKEKGIEPFTRLSFLIRQFTIGIQDNDPILKDLSKDKLTLFKQELAPLSLFFLKEGIRKKLDYSVIINLFYNNVSRLEEGRKVIVEDKAIDAFREYILDEPIAYLQNYIRTYITGPNKLNMEYYYHVGEPFHKQIFASDHFSFDEFIKKELSKKRISTDLMDDIQQFIKLANVNKDGIVVLYSEEIETKKFQDFNGEIKASKFHRLQSSEHKHTRLACLPPNYKE